MAKRTELITSFAIGFLFPWIFFYFNDADRATFPVIAGWFLLVLFPAALVIFAMSKKSLLRNAMTVVIMLSGMFTGTCAAIIVYDPSGANLFPIAAAIWTIIASVPIVLGSLFGPLVRRKSIKQ